MRIHPLLTTFSVLAVYLSGPPAFAGTVTQSHSVDCSSGEVSQSFFSGTDAPVTCALAGPDGLPGSFVSALARTVAGDGFLGLELRTDMQPFFSSGFAGASGVMRIKNDYIFSGPASNVITSMTLVLSGAVDFNCQPQGSDCHHEVDVIFDLTDESFSFTATGSYLRAVRSSLTTVPIGVPVAIGIGLDGSVSTGNCLGICTGEIFSDLNFIDTLSFNPDGPVFDLPGGFTVNGPCVVDNAFVCGEQAGSTPEPSTIFLMPGGLLVLAFAARSFRRIPGISLRQ